MEVSATQHCATQLGYKQCHWSQQINESWEWEFQPANVLKLTVKDQSVSQPAEHSTAAKSFSLTVLKTDTWGKVMFVNVTTVCDQ